MSTRCMIVIEDSDKKLYPVKVYKHCDGYPDGVMPILEPFAKAFCESRGDDLEYFIAQCLRAFAFEDSKEKPSKYYDPRTSFTGWGCCTYWHSDIAYLYIVNAATGTIEIRMPKDSFWDNASDDTYRKLTNAYKGDKS